MKQILMMMIAFVAALAQARAEESLFGGDTARGLITLKIQQPIQAFAAGGWRMGDIKIGHGEIWQGGLDARPSDGECTLITVLSAPTDSPNAFSKNPALSWKPGTVLKSVYGKRSTGTAVVYFRIGNGPLTTGDYDAILRCGEIDDAMSAAASVSKINKNLYGFARITK